MQIYSALYSSIAFTYPHIGAPLLAAVSKRVRDESLLAYYRSIQLIFSGTKTLVNYLTSIDSATLRELRHISVRGDDFSVKSADDNYYHGFYLSDVLLLFPGLKLNTLKVRASYHEPYTECSRLRVADAYDEVGYLIKSDGFRELIYISPSKSFLGFGPHSSSKIALGQDQQQEQQPSTWDTMIKKRDGAESGAEARIYRHTEKGLLDSKVGSETERSVDRGQITVSYEPIEVHVKRGRGVDFTQTGKCFFDPKWQVPFTDLFQRWTWEEIKQQKRYLDYDYCKTCAGR